MVINNPDNLNQTLLYQKLIAMRDDPSFSFKMKQEINKSITLIDQMSTDAIQIMKTFYTHFPEYTLHDETHLLAVANLMGIILDESNSIDNLSYIEITVLLLSAYLHDIGMAPESKKIDDIINSKEFLLYRQNILINHEGFKEISNILKNETPLEIEEIKYKSKLNEIEKSILTEYLRKDHGKFGYEYIIKKCSDDSRWIIEGYNIAEIVAWVCRGHTIDSKQIEFDYSENFSLDKLIGQNKINIRYCAILLRLADILDFDKKRTPKILYENISPKNEISIQEWNKHIAISGWSISSERIIFEAECTHPVYEKALRTFLDAIDHELQECKNIVNNFPVKGKIADKYQLNLPNSVDRSKIVPKGNAYSYMDLSFSLSHDEIMKLLMGTEFWGGNSLCIRELIQNAYDAIRHRQAVEKAQGIDWNDGKITLIQRLNDDGCLEFVCSDNGLGMNRHVIQNYFFNIGKSYYRSPEFEQIRSGLKQQNIDFDPVSQFGIGIVSSFMIGKSLKIITQRYKGPYHGCDEQLEINVDGFSRLVVVKTINDTNPKPGTTIIITGEKISISEASDIWSDPLRLLEATQFYAAALDIPIEVIIEPPFSESREKISPPKRPLRLNTVFELNSKVPSNNYTIIERNFNLMKNDCEGTIRIFFLIDESGRISTKNEWGEIILEDKYTKDSHQKFYNVIKKSNREKINKHHWCRSVLAQDGILVSLNDNIGREKLLHWGHRYPSPSFHFFGSYFINLKGNAKLPLKPNRAPYIATSFPRGQGEQIWSDFDRELDNFISLVIVDIVENNHLNPDPRTLWDIIDIYNFSLDGLEKNWTYSNIPIPIYSNNKSSKVEWNSLSQIYLEKNQFLSLGDELTTYPDVRNVPMNGIDLNYCSDLKISDEIIKIIRANTTLTLNENQVLYKINPVIKDNIKLEDFQFTENHFDRIYLQEYSEELMDYLSINNPTKSVNIHHPVIKFLLNNSRTPVDQYKWFRWTIFNIANCIVNDQDFDKIKPELWSKDTINCVLRTISHFKKIDWDQLPDNIKPPYKILYPNSGNIHEITLDYLLNKSSNIGLKTDEERYKLIDLS